MNYFSDTPFSSYKIEELDELGREINTLLAIAHGENDWIKPILGALLIKLLISQEAIGNSKKSKHTAEINEVDEKFDDSFIGFKNVAYNFVKSPNVTFQAASELLTEILKNNDDMLYKAGYTTQASKFNSLATDLSATNAIEALTTLQINDWFEAMKGMVAKIANLMRTRDADNLQKKVPTFKEAKEALRPQIEEVLSDLEFLHRKNEIEGLEDTMGKILEVIKRLNSGVRGRETRKKTTALEQQAQQPNGNGTS